MSRVLFTHRFERNLKSILDYISQERPAVAKRVIQDIRKSIYILEEYPNLGREGSVKGTLEMIVTQYPYIVVY